MKKLPVSIALISMNEAENIGRTLAAVCDWAEEIVVLDSGSTDTTVKIAESFGAKVFVEDWKGFSEQKNSALQKCGNDWILFLDCDEVPDVQLIECIKSAVITNNPGAYSINRRTNYFGKTLKYSWQPDRVLRLVHKSLNPRFTGGKVHEKLETDNHLNSPVGKRKNITNQSSAPFFKGGLGDFHAKTLDGFLIHYSYKNLTDHLEKTIKYARLGAEKYHESGKKFSAFNMIINPIWAFKRMYFFQLGFIEGIRGFLAAFSSFLGTFLKYVFLWELEFFDKRKKS